MKDSRTTHLIILIHLDRAPGVRAEHPAFALLSSPLEIAAGLSSFLSDWVRVRSRRNKTKLRWRVTWHSGEGSRQEISHPLQYPPPFFFNTLSLTFYFWIQIFADLHDCETTLCDLCSSASRNCGRFISASHPPKICVSQLRVSPFHLAVLCRAAEGPTDIVKVTYEAESLKGGGQEAGSDYGYRLLTMKTTWQQCDPVGGWVGCAIYVNLAPSNAWN